jgi:hypothetical protein
MMRTVLLHTANNSIQVTITSKQDEGGICSTRVWWQGHITRVAIIVWYAVYIWRATLGALDLVRDIREGCRTAILLM